MNRSPRDAAHLRDIWLQARAAAGAGSYRRLATGAARLGEAAAIAGGSRARGRSPASRRGSGLACGRHQARDACSHHGCRMKRRSASCMATSSPAIFFTTTVGWRPDRLGAGLDRRAGLDLGWMLMMIRRRGMAPELAAGRSDIRARSDRALSRSRRTGPPTTSNGIRHWRITVSARSPASMSNFIARASVRTPCGNASRHPFRSCSHAASSLPNARPAMIQKETVE